jgi:predicted NAD/FAD-dependent oxidoreductase
MMAELHGDAHLLQHRDGVAPEIGSVAEGGVIEVAAVVEGNRWIELAEQEELDLRMDVEGEPQVSRLLQGAFQHVPGIGEARGPIGQLDVAQHPGSATIRLPPGQHLEGRRIRTNDHVRFVDSGEPLDGRAVKTNSLCYGPLDLGGRDGHRLQRSQHIGEPEAHETDASFLHRAQHELCLPVHGTSVPQPSPPQAPRPAGNPE